MKIIIPVAGIGSRLKPHTNSTPKPLMEVAGKPIIDYIIKETVKINPSELIFVVGYKKNSIIDYIKEKFPKIKSSFVEQAIRDGDGSAVRLALENITKDEEILIIFGDTLIDFDLKKSIKSNNCDSMIFVMEVENPQNYGVVNIDNQNNIKEVEEKPQNPKSNLAIIGAYYFKSAFQVKKVLDNFYNEKKSVKGEYRVVQVIEEYIKDKTKKIKASKVKKWFDCGRPDVMLEANKYFLLKMSSGKTVLKNDFIIIPPAYVPKTALIKHSIIGPYASIGNNVKIENSIVNNSIISHGSDISNFILKDSLIGREVYLSGRMNKINLGEKSEVNFG